MAKDLYKEVANRLVAEIEDGVYPPGTHLPSIVNLAEEYDVSVGTVRAAQMNLRERGYLYTDHVGRSRRSVVRDRTKVDFVVTDAINGVRSTKRQDVFGELAERLGLEATKHFSMAVIPAPTDIALRLGVKTNDLIVRRRIIQKLNNEPWGLEDGHYPLDLAQELGLDSPSDIPEGTMRVLANAGHEDRAVVDEVYHWPVEEEESTIFDLPTGASLLGMIRTVASDSRITRVMRYGRVAHRIRLVWRLGDPDALSIIDAARGQEDDV